MTPDVRSLLEDSLAGVCETPAVALSGGIDSASCLFALLELDKSPRAYTFHIEGHESTDLRVARDVCRTFDVPFTPVELPTDLQTIKEDTYSIIEGLGYTKKSQIETIWPFTYLLPAIDERELVSGLCSDSHFVVFREPLMNGVTESVEKMDRFRSNAFSDPDLSQHRMVEKLAEQYDIEKTHIPYYDRAMVNAFIGTAWEDINEPHQKQPILDAFPDYFSQIKVRNRQNLHGGDTLIREQFEQLVDSTWNIEDWKSPVGIYNAVARGEVP